MKLTTTQRNMIVDAAKAASAVNVDAIIFKDGLISGFSEDRTRMVYHKFDADEFDFDQMGIRRIKELITRSGIFDDATSLTINSTQSKLAESLQFTGKGIRLKYKCANPTSIKGLGTLKYAAEYEYTIPTDIRSTLFKAMAALKPEFVTLSLSTETATISFKDAAGDDFAIDFIPNVSEDIRPVSFKYATDVFLSVWKLVGDGAVGIDSRGLTYATIHNTNVVLLPNQERRQ